MCAHCSHTYSHTTPAGVCGRVQLQLLVLMPVSTNPPQIVSRSVLPLVTGDRLMAAQPVCIIVKSLFGRKAGQTSNGLPIPVYVCTGSTKTAHTDTLRTTHYDPCRRMAMTSTCTLVCVQTLHKQTACPTPRHVLPCCRVCSPRAPLLSCVCAFFCPALCAACSLRASPTC